MAASAACFAAGSSPRESSIVLESAHYTGGIPATIQLVFSGPVLAGSLPSGAIRVDGEGSFQRQTGAGSYPAGTAVTRTLNTTMTPTSAPPRVSFAQAGIFTGADGLPVPQVTDFPIT